MPKATMTSKGQITIPKPIRDRLGLRPGDKLDFSVQRDGTLRVRPLGPDGQERPLAGFLEGRVRVQKRVTLEDMEQGIAEAVTRRYLRSVGAVEEECDD